MDDIDEDNDAAWLETYELPDVDGSTWRAASLLDEGWDG